MSASETVVVADANRLTWERAFNPRTISMPALPIVKGSFDPAAKTVLASFRGAESHPCRRALADIANSKTIRVELINRSALPRHCGSAHGRPAVRAAAFPAMTSRNV
jgi:hypothetical protein